MRSLTKAKVRRKKAGKGSATVSRGRPKGAAPTVRRRVLSLGALILAVVGGLVFLFFWSAAFVALLVNRLKPDVVFSPMQTMGSLGRRYRLVLTVHDLIYYRHRTPPRDLPAPVRALVRWISGGSASKGRARPRLPLSWW